MLAMPRMPLPATIAKKAESFFNVSFSQTRMAIEPQLGSKGLTALTNGRHIWIDPTVLSLSQTDQNRVLGHEMMHIVQQRQGRVPSSAHPEEHSAAMAALESEADRAGEAFATGKRFKGCPSPALRSVSHSVWQPLVSVGGDPLNSLDQLPGCVLQVTSFIEGGLEWLQWALGEKSSRFEFPNTLSLVTEIQNGLHGEGLVLVPERELLIHPLALLSLADLGIEALSAAHRQDPVNSVVSLEAQRVLESQGYLSQSQLTAVTAFLSQVDLAGNPLFQTLTLQDQVDIYQAIAVPKGSWSLRVDFQKEAAAYASAYSANPASFADFYSFYTGLASSAEFRKRSAPERARWARVRSDEVALALRKYMRCAVLGEIYSPDAVQSQLRAWFSGGNDLGFARVSEGVARLSESQRIAQASGDGLTAEVRDYLRQARDSVHSGTVAGPRVSQNGQFFIYEFQTLNQKATVRVACGSGCTTLAGIEGFSHGAQQASQPVAKPVGA